MLQKMQLNKQKIQHLKDSLGISFKDTANKFASSAKDTAASLGKAAKESGPSGFMRSSKFNARW